MRHDRQLVELCRSVVEGDRVGIQVCGHPVMRAAIYAHYSSRRQSAASVEDQVRICKERISREGWQLVEVFQDRAISGATALRPGYQAVLAAGRNHDFDMVVAEALDRLSRGQEDVAALYKRLCFAGIRIVTLAEGEITELHVGLKGTMNALFLKDLAAKTVTGAKPRARLHFVLASTRSGRIQAMCEPTG